MSAILKAEDLNDFISPGVACIKPVENLPEETPEYGEVEIQIDKEGNPLEISKIDGKQQKLSAAQISLADCLACSGCITSAEEVLVAQHSFDQLVNTLHSQRHTKIFVASICHQARSSLAEAFKTSVESVDRMLIDLFVNQMGFKYVVGTSLGRKLSLVNEFEHVYQRKTDNNNNGPILSSVCPGWVLYAEKTHPEVLDRLSTVKSPQQFTGCIIKSLVTEAPRDDIYHVSIMPCFDKKLESARPELGEPKVADVDCVLTPRELVNLVEQNSQYDFNFNSPLLAIPVQQLYQKYAPVNWPFVEHSWSNDSGSTSGGWGFNYLLQYKEKMLRDAPGTYPESSNFVIKRINGKNNDVYELRLEYNSEKVASTAVINGFRNIQNLVRKLKAPEKAAKTSGRAVVARRRMRTSRSATPNGSDEAEDVDPTKCDYVEIMACPSGCINGGGQISHDKDVNEKEWLEQCVAKYESIPTLELDSDLVSSLINWCNNFYEVSGITSDRLTTTYFKEVEKPKDQASILLGSKW